MLLSCCFCVPKALAQIVAEQMGGPHDNEKDLIRKWQKNSQKLKKKYKSVVIPIGKLRTGLSRHRALLYKASQAGQYPMYHDTL